MTTDIIGGLCIQIVLYMRLEICTTFVTKMEVLQNEGV